MSDAIPWQAWLQRIDEEYLSTFIRDGGASCKFAVTPDPLVPTLRAALQERCQELDYLFLALDAAQVRAHMAQDVFFAMAGQIDWRRLARRRLLRLAADCGYETDAVDAGAADNVFDAVAAANGRDPNIARQRLETLIHDRVSKNRGMVRDYRVAMTALCLWEDSPAGGEYAAQPVLDWLTGRNRRLSSVRPFSIFRGIDRTSARYFIESTLHWVRDAGLAGTVVLFDNRRVTVPRNPRDDLRYYTRPMVMDHYELLREFVDGVDRLTGALMLVAAGDGFVDDGFRSRGVGIYEALKTRVMNEVRDRNRPNPVASLVRLSEGERG